MKIIILIGLPGSGKSHLGNHLSNELMYEFYDDVSVHYKDIREILEKRENCIISDCNLCIPEVLEHAKNILEEYSKEIVYLYFSNEPNQCLLNVIERNDGRNVESLINGLSKYYLPKYEEMIPVYKKIS